MKIKMVMKWDGITPELYEKVRKIADWEGNAPKGAIFHVAGFIDNGLRVTDIWESVDDLQSFVQNRLMPAVEQAGWKGGQPEVEVFPIHAIYVANATGLN